MNKLILYILTASMMTGTLMAQVEPGAGNWKTWVIPSGNAFRLPPPPDNEITGTELEWVKDSISHRDPATLTAIHFWDAGSPGYRWMQLAEQSVVTAGLPAPLQTRALALVAAAISDATVAAWDSKYAFNRPHPGDSFRHLQMPEFEAKMTASAPSSSAALHRRGGRILAQCLRLGEN